MKVVLVQLPSKTIPKVGKEQLSQGEDSGMNGYIDMLHDIPITSWWLNHPFEKYARQNGNLPHIGVKIKHI